MKKRLFVLALLAVCVTAAQAGLDFVGLTDVKTTYTANSQVFSMQDSGLVAVLNYDDSTPQGSITPVNFTLSTTLSSGMSFTGGTFALTDGSATLLGGNVISVEFEEVFGWLAGKGTASVTQSNIAGFPAGPAEIISLTFNLKPAFTGFTQDYTGLTKVNLGVPEPATMVLLGLGSLLLRKRK